MEMKNTLTIQKIDAQVTLSIIANLDNKKIELPVKYSLVSENELASLKSVYGEDILPIDDIVKEWEEQIFKVTFRGRLSKIDLVAVDTEGVYRWGDIKIFKVKLATGRNIQLIKVNNPDGERFNRRRGVRVDLDRRMRIDVDTGAHTVLVKDLSYCGVSFVRPQGVEFPNGKQFLLHLTDFDSKGEQVELARLICKVINFREDKGEPVYGCVISAKHSQYLQRYIAKKQMEEISGKREFVGYQRAVEGDDWQLKVAKALDQEMNGAE